MVGITKVGNKFSVVFFAVWCGMLLYSSPGLADSILKQGEKPERFILSDRPNRLLVESTETNSDMSLEQSDFDYCAVRENNDSPSFQKRLYQDLKYATKTTLSDFRYIYSSPSRFNKKSALWLGGILTVGGIIFTYDQDIYDAIHRNKNHRFYKPVRHLGNAVEPMGYMGFSNKILFSMLAIGYVGRIDPFVNISADLLETFIIGSPNKIVKYLVGRNGPGDDLGSRSSERGDGWSFPSGHSMNIMELAHVLSKHIDYKPFTIASYTAASSVLLQRITSDHHWPSDVFAGAVFGWTMSHTLQKLKTNRKMNITPMNSSDNGGTGLLVSIVF